MPQSQLPVQASVQLLQHHGARGGRLPLCRQRNCTGREVGEGLAEVTIPHRQAGIEIPVLQARGVAETIWRPKRSKSKSPKRRSRSRSPRKRRDKESTRGKSRTRSRTKSTKKSRAKKSSKRKSRTRSRSRSERKKIKHKKRKSNSKSNSRSERKNPRGERSSSGKSKKSSSGRPKTVTVVGTPPRCSLSDSDLSVDVNVVKEETPLLKPNTVPSRTPSVPRPNIRKPPRVTTMPKLEVVEAPKPPRSSDPFPNPPERDAAAFSVPRPEAMPKIEIPEPSPSVVATPTGSDERSTPNPLSNPTGGPPPDPSAWSSDNVADLLAKFFAPFASYREAILANGLDGMTLLACEDSDLKDVLKELGVTKAIHRIKMTLAFKSLHSQPSE